MTNLRYGVSDEDSIFSDCDSGDEARSRAYDESKSSVSTRLSPGLLCLSADILRAMEIKQRSGKQTSANPNLLEFHFCLHVPKHFSRFFLKFPLKSKSRRFSRLRSPLLLVDQFRPV